MFNQQTKAPIVAENHLPEELQLQYLLEPQLAHASWSVRAFAGENTQEKSHGRSY